VRVNVDGWVWVSVGKCDGCVGECWWVVGDS
jgi:hypothetical protein